MVYKPKKRKDNFIDYYNMEECIDIFYPSNPTSMIDPKTIYNKTIAGMLNELNGNQLDEDWYDRVKAIMQLIKPLFPKEIELCEQSNFPPCEDKKTIGFFYYDDDRNAMLYGKTEEELKAQIGQ